MDLAFAARFVIRKASMSESNVYVHDDFFFVSLDLQILILYTNCCLSGPSCSKHRKLNEFVKRSTR